VLCNAIVVCQWLNKTVLVHGQVTIIFVVSVCLFVQFFSAVFDPISIKLGHMGLVVSPRIQGLCDPWGAG